MENADLCAVCKDGSLAEISKCLETKENKEIALNSTFNDNGLLPLHLAVLRPSQEAMPILEKLLTCKADVNVQSKLEGDTALLLAVRYNDTRSLDDVIALLLLADADVEIRNNDIRRPYDYALSRGDIGLSDLLYACEEDEGSRQTLVQNFLDERASHHGLQLIEAIIKGNNQQIENCLTMKTDYNALNKHGAGSIHYTITHYPGDKVALLQKLLNRKADVNLTTAEGDTALNLAIKHGELRADQVMYKLAELLVKKKIKIDIKDLDGHNARSLAEKHKYKDIIKLLDTLNKPVQRDPPPQPKAWPVPPKERTPTPPPPSPSPEPASEPEDDTDKLAEFFAAVKEGDAKDVQRLLNHPKVNAIARNSENDSAIHLAVRRKDNARIQIISLLLAHRANKDAKDKDGQCPLHIAATLNDIPLVYILLDAGCDSTFKNEEGKYPHEVAEALEHTEIETILRKHCYMEKLTKKKKTRTCLIS